MSTVSFNEGHVFPLYRREAAHTGLESRTATPTSASSVSQCRTSLSADCSLGDGFESKSPSQTLISPVGSRTPSLLRSSSARSRFSFSYSGGDRSPRAPGTLRDDEELSLDLVTAGSALSNAPVDDFARILRDAHLAYADVFAAKLGLQEVTPQQRHIVNLASVDHGNFLADYLGIPRQQVLTLKSGRSIRVGTGGKTIAGGSRLQRMQTAVKAYLEGKSFYQAAVVVIGSYNNPLKNKSICGTQDPTGDDMPLCGFLRPDELTRLLGGEAFAPASLTLFSCGSRAFARGMVASMANPPRVLSYSREQQQVLVFPPLGEKYPEKTGAFYYAASYEVKAKSHRSVLKEGKQTPLASIFVHEALR